MTEFVNEPTCRYRVMKRFELYKSIVGRYFYILPTARLECSNSLYSSRSEKTKTIDLTDAVIFIRDRKYRAINILKKTLFRLKKADYQRYK